LQGVKTACQRQFRLEHPLQGFNLEDGLVGLLGGKESGARQDEARLVGGAAKMDRRGFGDIDFTEQRPKFLCLERRQLG